MLSLFEISICPEGQKNKHTTTSWNALHLPFCCCRGGRPVPFALHPKAGQAQHHRLPTSLLTQQQNNDGDYDNPCFNTLGGGKHGSHIARQWGLSKGSPTSSIVFDNLIFRTPFSLPQACWLKCSDWTGWKQPGTGKRSTPPNNAFAGSAGFTGPPEEKSPAWEDWG